MQWQFVYSTMTLSLIIILTLPAFLFQKLISQFTGEIQSDLRTLEHMFPLLAPHAVEVNTTSMFNQFMSLLSAIVNYSPSTKYKGKTSLIQPCNVQGVGGGILKNDFDISEVKTSNTLNMLQAHRIDKPTIFQNFSTVRVP